MPLWVVQLLCAFVIILVSMFDAQVVVVIPAEALQLTQPSLAIGQCQND